MKRKSPIFEKNYPILQNSNYVHINEKKVACIILPTYNESLNIVNLLDKIFDVEKLQKRNKNAIFCVLIVDDNSPDGTAKIVSDYNYKNEKVHLLVREKKDGLGSAYIDGMKYALMHLKPDIIFEMDADFSHNPLDLLRLLEKIDEGADFVIGSRYVLGGTTPNGWGLHREIMSRTANGMAKIALNNNYNIKDITGGFRAFRSDLLKKINLDNLGAQGYAFQISFLNEVMKLNPVIVEVPIHFSNRINGESKVSVNDILEIGKVVMQIGTENMFSRQEAVA